MLQGWFPIANRISVVYYRGKSKKFFKIQNRNKKVTVIREFLRKTIFRQNWFFFMVVTNESLSKLKIFNKCFLYTIKFSKYDVFWAIYRQLKFLIFRSIFCFEMVFKLKILYDICVDIKKIRQNRNLIELAFSVPVT